MSDETKKTDNPSDWLFDHTFETQKKGLIQLAIGMGFYVIISLFSLLLNLTAIETIDFDFFIISVTVNNSLSAKLVILAVSVCSGILLMILSVQTMMQLMASISFLAHEGNERAQLFLSMVDAIEQPMRGINKVNQYLTLSVILVLIVAQILSLIFYGI